MHLFNRRAHDGSSSIIQIGEGMDVIEVEILEVVGEQVIVGIFAPREVSVQRKEVVLERRRSEETNPPAVQ
ncbi:MAG: carbon storage regulator [Janthinobacterium lividum]